MKDRSGVIEAKQAMVCKDRSNAEEMRMQHGFLGHRRETGVPMDDLDAFAK